MEENKKKKNPTIITKVSLVIYCLIMLLCFIGLITASSLTKNNSLIFGYLLCLGPGFIFAFVSLLLPTVSIMAAKLGKGGIATYCILYVIKYGLIIGIPCIGMVYSQHFNRWVMLAITLIAPIQVLITKIVYANAINKHGI